MKSLASKRLRSNRGPSRLLSDEDMWDLIDSADRERLNEKQVRERTRTQMDVTLSISYPNPKAGGYTHPSIWNWQFLASKAFPDAEVAVKCWTHPHPDWS
jgi:hypothetical protein